MSTSIIAPIKHVDAFQVVGLEYFGKNEQGEISALWPVFNERCEDIAHAVNDGAYGVCSEMDKEGRFSYVCSMKVSQATDIPEGMITKHVPAGHYAVFTFEGPLSDLGAFYGNIYNVWLKELGYTYDMRPDFEHYDDRFMSTGAFDIYIPVKG